MAKPKGTANSTLVIPRVLTRRASRFAVANSSLATDNPSQQGKTDKQALGTATIAPTSSTRQSKTTAVLSNGSGDNLTKSAKRRHSPSSSIESVKKRSGTSRPVGTSTTAEAQNPAESPIKHSKDTKASQRSEKRKERLAELENIERAIMNGTQADYNNLLQDIQLKKDRSVDAIGRKRDLQQVNIRNNFVSLEKMAHDEYQVISIARVIFFCFCQMHSISIRSDRYG
ncbi:uncharacterized protein BYT42DRAFT_95603 [Radiomyces spectabilis]|uniref:uncharacterized protein n=1 Tax=Radiomyces spectabilis TaxID=64574 RepID=UPI002220C919|nr:uncharacterized protein BYT42DRAFT_95603 [Radiomyces spectabilis]KAI8370607.1 hypothetical protein BYT42DRAFT_95603 [Radiomyces spectabilis]